MTAVGAGRPGPAGSAIVTSERPHRIELDVRADRPAVLVLLDTLAPGWVAEVDGRTVPIAQVDGPFRGIAVAPDVRHVVVRYSPGFTYLGFLAAALAAITSVAWIWFVGRRPRPLSVDRAEGAGREPDAAAARIGDVSIPTDRQLDG